jgi:hypothetical protein
MIDEFDPHKQLAQENHGLIIHQMGLFGQNNLAAYLGVSNSTITKWKGESGEFETYARAMAFLSIRNRLTSDRCFTEKQIQHYDMLAEIGREYLAKYPRMSDIR